MKGLTTVARLPGSGNGRHAALEAQDLGKAAAPPDTKACSDERPCTACFSDDGPCEDISTKGVTLPDVMRAVQAHMLALADAIGLTPEQRELLERKMPPVFNCRSVPKPITLTFKVTDLSDEDRVKFEEAMRLSVPISVGCDFAKENLLDPYYAPDLDKDDVAFLAANGVDPRHVNVVQRDLAKGMTHYRLLDDDRFCELLRDHARPEQSTTTEHNGPVRVANTGEPRARGRYVFTDAQARIDLGSRTSLDPLDTATSGHLDLIGRSMGWKRATLEPDATYRMRLRNLRETELHTAALAKVTGPPA